MLDMFNLSIISTCYSIAYGAELSLWSCIYVQININHTHVIEEPHP